MTHAERLKEDYLSEEFVCEFLKITRKTMQTRRSEGRNHPPCIKEGRIHLYPAAEFYSWLKQKRVIKAVV